MPKTKTHSSAKKRFKITGAGRLLRRKAMQSHNLGKKSAKRKREFTQDQPLAASDAKNVAKLFPGKVK